MRLQTEADRFLETFNRSRNTLRTYRNALAQFVQTVGADAELTTENYVRFLTAIRDLSPSTQRGYRTAVLALYAFCNTGDWPALKAATKHYTKKIGRQIVNFNREPLEQVLTYCASLADRETGAARLEALRDRAFVLTLADTGLRISEACALKRGDVDWMEQRAVIVGKGDKQAVVYFSNRSIQAMKDYLNERAQVEPNSRIPLASQPVFARHDICARHHVRPVSDSGMRKAIKERMEQAGVEKSLVRLHDFRHYFVTMVYAASNDIKRAQEFARHESIATTNRYTHLISDASEAYDEIFNRSARG